MKRSLHCNFITTYTGLPKIYMAQADKIFTQASQKWNRESRSGTVTDENSQHITIRTYLKALLVVQISEFIINNTLHMSALCKS
jgi:hypothetical protein